VIKHGVESIRPGRRMTATSSRGIAVMTLAIANHGLAEEQFPGRVVVLRRSWCGAGRGTRFYWVSRLSVSTHVMRPRPSCLNIGELDMWARTLFALFCPLIAWPLSSRRCVSSW